MKTHREELVQGQLRSQGVVDERVIDALMKVPREEFVPIESRSRAYANVPLEIGQEQTISQPLVVGLMTQLLKINKGDKVLEIGTGSGYQTAILLEMGASVYSIERIPELAERAKGTLQRLGYKEVHLKTGSGFAGWPEEAPFRGIIVTAAPREIPPALLEQLAEEGRMVIPVGPRSEQNLEVITKREGKIYREISTVVRFVPMV